MRTVVPHLKTATEEQVETFLRRTYPSQKGPPWISEVEGDACLYIDIYRDLAFEHDPAEIADLYRELGGAPTTSVAANVSGRHPGDREVREFVSKLLTEFEGLARDEYTDGSWTPDDIRTEQKRNGRTFFDYRSAYESKP